METASAINFVDSERPIFSVRDITLRLQRLVEGSFSDIRVQGEISGFKKHASGHRYFTLKDQDAIIDAVCWRGSASNNPIKLEEGLEIIASGRLTVYGPRSKYQLVVESYEPTGQGALLKLLEDRKAKLAAEGLFADARKRRLPAFPQTIGVVTSPTGAVIRDILHRVTERFPCRVLVWPSAVQGEGAAEKIAAAIQGFNRIPAQHSLRPDILIVARGGGSLEDLWAFNEECVVRAAAASEIPLISAVGHETDITLIDFASDKRAPTPTAAAEMALPVISDLWFSLQNWGERSHLAMQRQLEKKMLRLDALSRSIPDPLRLIMEKTQRLDDTEQRLGLVTQNFLHKATYRLMSLSQNIKTPQDRVSLSEQHLTTLSQRFREASTRFFDARIQGLTTLDHRLNQASHHRTLERGYCLATDPQGNIIQQAKDFPKTGPATLTFHDKDIAITRAQKARRSVRAESSSAQQGKLF